MLIASSGDAETEAVQAAADAWADGERQRGRGDRRPGHGPAALAGLRRRQPAGRLLPRREPLRRLRRQRQPLPLRRPGGERRRLLPLAARDLHPRRHGVLRAQGLLHPRRSRSTPSAWEAAGLTDADIPTTWDELADVAAKLTTDDQVGLAIGRGRDRAGAFLVQNGGFWVDSETGEVTADASPTSRRCSTSRTCSTAATPCLRRPPSTPAGAARRSAPGGRDDHRGQLDPRRDDRTTTPTSTTPSPSSPRARPARARCCSPSAGASPPSRENQEAAVDLVEALTAPDQQLAFADAFGVMPSRESAQADYVDQFPEDAPFIAGGEYGQGPVNLPGLAALVAAHEPRRRPRRSSPRSRPTPSRAARCDAAPSRSPDVLLHGGPRPERGTREQPTRGDARRPASRGGAQTRRRMAVRRPHRRGARALLAVPILMALWVSFTDWTGRAARSPSAPLRRRRQLPASCSPSAG